MIYQVYFIICYRNWKPLILFRNDSEWNLELLWCVKSQKCIFSHAFLTLQKSSRKSHFWWFLQTYSVDLQHVLHLSFVRSLSGKNERKNNENVLHVTGIRLYISFGVTVLSWTSNGARRILPCTKQHSQNGKSKSTILIAIRICTVVHHPFGTIEP